MVENKKGKADVKGIIGQCLVYLELIIVAVIVIYPVVWIIGAAFNPNSSISSPTPIPKGATLDNFKNLFSKTNYASWYKNTLYVAVMTMIFGVIINTATAFVFARFKFRGRKVGLLTIVILQMFPAMLSLTAIYMLALNFGLLNNLNMLVIVYVAGSIPGNIWLVKGYMQNIPRSLDEAAYIDGASKLQIFYKVIIPLATPIIFFMAFNAFMAPWMDYMLPRLLINQNDKTTLAVGLFDFIKTTASTRYYNYFAAGAILVAVPLAGFYMYFQKYLLEGLTAGANKGD